MQLKASGNITGEVFEYGHGQNIANTSCKHQGSTGRSVVANSRRLHPRVHKLLLLRMEQPWLRRLPAAVSSAHGGIPPRVSPTAHCGFCEVGGEISELQQRSIALRVIAEWMHVCCGCRVQGIGYLCGTRSRWRNFLVNMVILY